MEKGVGTARWFPVPRHWQPALLRLARRRPRNRNPLFSLVILSWNARSLLRKQADFIRLLEDHKVDVAVVQEARLLPDHRRLGAYDVLQGRHPDGHAVALFIHQSLHYEPLPLPLPPDLGLEVIGASIRTATAAIPVVGLYALGQHRVPPHAWGQLGRTAPPNSLYLGDVNAHHPAWGSTAADARGEQVRDWASAQDLVYLLFSLLFQMLTYPAQNGGCLAEYPRNRDARRPSQHLGTTRPQSRAHVAHQVRRIGLLFRHDLRGRRSGVETVCKTNMVF